MECRDDRITSAGRSLANRLAAHELRGVIGESVIQCRMPLQLHILQLFLIHPEIVTEFVYDGQADLFVDFRVAGANRLNILLVEDV